jgi:hypothetical protein
VPQSKSLFQICRDYQTVDHCHTHIFNRVRFGWTHSEPRELRNYLTCKVQRSKVGWTLHCSAAPQTLHRKLNFSTALNIDACNHPKDVVTVERVFVRHLQSVHKRMRNVRSCPYVCLSVSFFHPRN